MVVRLVSRGGVQAQNAKAVNSGVSSVANGVVIASDNDALVASIGERPLGIVVDDIPTDNPPRFLSLAVTGDTIEDTGLTSATIGATIYSDGDGTYSASAPATSEGDTYWILGFVTDSDASSTFIELDIQAATDGAV